MVNKLFKVVYWKWGEKYDHETYCNKIEHNSCTLSYHCFITHNGKDYQTLMFDDNKLISCEEIL